MKVLFFSENFPPETNAAALEQCETITFKYPDSLILAVLEDALADTVYYCPKGILCREPKQNHVCVFVR